MTPRRQGRAGIRDLALVVVALGTLLVACAGAGETTGPRAGSGAASTASAPIALSPDGARLWVVNPDADSVTAVRLPELVAEPAIDVGAEPWAVAVTPGGTVLVMNRAAGSITFLEEVGSDTSSGTSGGTSRRTSRRTSRDRFDLSVGPEPGGLALSHDGALAFVSLSADAELAVIDVTSRTVIDRLPLGPLPWAVATSGSGEELKVIVSHRQARPVPGRSATADDGREGWLSVIAGLGDPGTGLEPRIEELVLPGNPFGFPNALEAMTVVDATEGSRLHVAHLLNSPAPPNDFQTSVSGGLSTVRLGADGEPSAGGTPLAEPLPDLSLDLNDRSFSTPTNFPRAIAAAPDAQTLYVVLAGTDAVMGIDVSVPDEPDLLGFWTVGNNPRGIVVAPDGRTAYVMNYLSRDVSVLDLQDTSQRVETARVSVVEETLTAELLRGKLLFNNAADPRLSRTGWISCASCHLDGGSDGTSWPREEGVRQTMPLWRLADTAPYHAAGTRDELQDFEVDIERFMRGVGLAPGAVGPLLGPPSAGGSADLDALAAFLETGIRIPAASGGDALARERGRAVYQSSGCQSCHAGPAWTISSLPGTPGTLAPEGEEVVLDVLHDVGTYDPTVDITGAAGFDVPTLLGLAHTAPYFHNGSAPDLESLLAHRGHSGPPLSEDETADLVAFLLSIDESTEPFSLP